MPEGIPLLPHPCEHEGLVVPKLVLEAPTCEDEGLWAGRRHGRAHDSRVVFKAMARIPEGEAPLLHPCEHPGLVVPVIPSLPQRGTMTSNSEALGSKLMFDLLVVC